MKTGVMYLCKTSSKKTTDDKMYPYTYNGSGIRWVNHIKKHKSYIITCIVGVYQTKEELSIAGLHYSKLYNVVKARNWANMTEERGDGGLIGTGQLGRRWRIKDTTNMCKTKTVTEKRIQGLEKVSGKNNYQFKGLIKTPWGIFESGKEALNKGKELRVAGNTEVITDGGTLRKYLLNLDSVLSVEGRRTPRHWRGKSPRDIGFDIIKDDNERVYV